MGKSGEEEVDRLKRRLRREQLARKEAEQLLEEKSLELYEAGQELKRESEVSKKLVEALEVATDGIAATDPEGVFTYMNAAHAALFGYDAEELLGSPWSVLYEPRWAAEIAATAIPEVLAKGSWRGEATGLRKDGRPVEQEITLTARPGGEGLICVTRDAGERKRRRARIHQLEHELRESERSAALLTLRSAIAHDLGNLIGIIDGYATLLGAELTAGRPRERARKILTASQAARDILSELGREADAAEGGFQEVDLAASLRKILELIEAIKPPSVLLTTDLPLEAKVLAKEVLLSRCILNVTKNAFEVMPDGGTLAIRLAAGPRGGHEAEAPGMRLGPEVTDPAWILEIEDTGPGFPEGALRSLLRPFASTKTNEALSGLGLSSVALLAESRAAAVEIDSRPGEGALFRILFPKTEARSVEVTGTPADAPVGGRIVVIEDNPDVGDVVASLLEAEGLDVSLLTDPQLAREVLLGGANVDAVVTDLDMPLLNGEELAAAVATSRPDLPFVLLTAMPERVERRSLFSAVLQKPADKDALGFAVRHALSVPRKQEIQLTED